MKVKLGGAPLNILDFDVECRPLSWYGGDFVTKEITAIAWKWVGSTSKPVCVALGDTPGRFANHLSDLGSVLWNFQKVYDVADVVTGHYIRGFDLPTINGGLIELGMPGLGPKLTHDTKLDMVKASGLSKSQENLGAVLGLKHPKIGMNQATWREANRLTPAGIALTKKRCAGDVEQHIELRRRMLQLGILDTRLKLWTPESSGRGRYAP